MRATGGKRVTENDLLGQRGINPIERIVQEIGFVWNPTGPHDAGLDGSIEIRDPATGEITNSMLFVQNKAGDSYFRTETEETFEFICKNRDLDYWLGANAHVIVIVPRPDAGKAYWVPLNQYFARNKRARTADESTFWDPNAGPSVDRL
jgi:Domain of unknown function (DUF4365)